jgi:hypothetical protein
VTWNRNITEIVITVWSMLPGTTLSGTPTRIRNCDTVNRATHVTRRTSGTKHAARFLAVS